MGKGFRKAAVVAAGAVAGGAAMTAALAALRNYVKRTNVPFYAAAKRCFPIPGIDEGFVPQDLFHLDVEGVWLFSGYRPHHPSPLYRRTDDGHVSRLKVQLPDGSVYQGHGAAVTAAGPFVFLTVSDGYVVLHRGEVVRAEDGATVRAFGHVPVELLPAFMIVEDNRLFIGEFYHHRFYETPESHRLPCADGAVNPALMYAYDFDADAPYGFAGQASAVYSIPGDIQGMCIAADGRLVLSRSWGVGDASLLVYDPSRIRQRGTYLVDGREAPLYFLDAESLVDTVTVPPMAEGVTEFDGQVYLANEAASNLYRVGKSFGGRFVYALPL